MRRRLSERFSCRVLYLPGPLFAGSRSVSSIRQAHPGGKIAVPCRRKTGATVNNAPAPRIAPHRKAAPIQRPPSRQLRGPSECRTWALPGQRPEINPTTCATLCPALSRPVSRPGTCGTLRTLPSHWRRRYNAAMPSPYRNRDATANRSPDANRNSGAKRRRRLALCLTMGWLYAAPAYADFNDGVVAYLQGDMVVRRAHIHIIT